MTIMLKEEWDFMMSLLRKQIKRRRRLETEMSFFKQSEGPIIYNSHGIPRSCPECGGGLVRKRVSDLRKDLICALCGITVGSLVRKLQK